MESQSKREDRAAGAAVVCIFAVLFAAWGAYLLVAIALLLGHLFWVKHALIPLMPRLVMVSGFGFVPLFLLLSLFARTRLAAGMGFFGISGIFTFVTGITCAMYVYSVWSWTALVCGTAVVGYGIFPLALIAALTRHQWSLAWTIVSGLIMLFGAMYLGLALMVLSFSAPPLRMPDNPTSS